MHPRRIRLLLLLSSLLSVAPGCRKGEITVYRVPKEAAAPLTMAGPSAGHPNIDWTVPQGWTEQASSGMRAGSFAAKASDGSVVDISVVPLAGEAGGELANVNRWRGQLNLPPTTQEGLSSVVKSTRIGRYDARVVEFSSADGKRLLAAVLKNGATSWFFKATGSDKAVKELRPAFLSFVESARFHDAGARHE